MSRTTCERNVASKHPMRRLSLLAALATLVAIALATSVSPRFVSAQFVGGLNLSLTAAPGNAAVGQVVTFSYRASPRQSHHHSQALPL